MANIVPFIRRVEKIAEKTIVKISLTFSACKVSEKIVKDRVVNLWQTLNVFNRNQFGVDFPSVKENQLKLDCCVTLMTGHHQEINQDPLMLYF